MVNVRSKFGRTFGFSRVVASLLALILLLSPVLISAASAEGSSAELKAAIDGVDISLKAILDEENSVFALLGALGAEGQVAMDANLYLTGRALILESATILGQTYGIDLTHYAENLAASVFAPDSGSVFALDEDTYSALQGNLDGVVITGAGMPASLEELTSILLEPLSDAMESLLDAAEMSRKPDTLESLVHGAQEVQLNRIVFSTEALCNAGTQFITQVQQNEEAKVPMAQIVGALRESGGIVAEENVTNEDLVEVIWENLPELAEQLTASLNESKVSLEITAAENEKFEHIAVTLNVDGESGSVVFESYNEMVTNQNSEETGAIWYCLGMYLPDEEPIEAGVAYIKNPGWFEINGQLSEGGQATYHFEFEVDPAYYYSLQFGEDEIITRIRGDILHEDGNLVITLGSIDNEPVGDIRLILRDTDSVTVPAFTEILTLSEEEMTQLMMTINAFAGSFVEE